MPLPLSDQDHSISTLDRPADYDRRAFFEAVREVLNQPRLSQGFVDGSQAILDVWTASPYRLRKQIAYILATAYLETAWTMEPVREIGRGAGRAYGEKDPLTGQTYYGRGFVQLTWRGNYAVASEQLSAMEMFELDLVRQPDDALEPDVAAAILIYGMMEGWFTGIALPEFVDDKGCDFVAARQTVNGHDKADELASLALLWDAVLQRSAVVDVFRPDSEDDRPARAHVPCHRVSQLVRQIKRLTGAKRVEIHY